MSRKTEIIDVQIEKYKEQGLKVWKSSENQQSYKELVKRYNMGVFRSVLLTPMYDASTFGKWIKTPCKDDKRISILEQEICSIKKMVKLIEEDEVITFGGETH